MSPTLRKSRRALGKSLAKIYHLLSLISRLMRSQKKFVISLISFMILLFCNISNFDIINLTTFLSAFTTTSLLPFLISLIRLFPIHAMISIIMNTDRMIKNTPRQRFRMIIVNIAIMLTMILINPLEKISIANLCRLSHHLWIILLDCPVQSHSILLLSAFRYLERCSS